MAGSKVRCVCYWEFGAQSGVMMYPGVRVPWCPCSSVQLSQKSVPAISPPLHLSLFTNSLLVALYLRQIKNRHIVARNSPIGVKISPCCTFDFSHPFLKLEFLVPVSKAWFFAFWMHKISPKRRSWSRVGECFFFFPRKKNKKDCMHCFHRCSSRFLSSTFQWRASGVRLGDEEFRELCFKGVWRVGEVVSCLDCFCLLEIRV